MKRRLRPLVFCLALLAAVAAASAQDAGGGGGSGGASGGAGGNTGGNTGGSGGDNSSGGNGSDNNSDENNTLTPAPGANSMGGNQQQNNNNSGNQGENGTEMTPPAPANGGNVNSILPPETTPATPENPLELIPGPNSPATPTPQPGLNLPGGVNGLNQGVLSAPVTLTLPGGYGQSAQTFTLGQGRLSRPPIIFSLSLSEGYDSNIFSSPSVPATPAVTEQAPPETIPRVINFHINPPFPPSPVYGTPIVLRARPVVIAPANPGEHAISSAVTTASLGAQVQMADPRTVLTLDVSLNALDYSADPSLQYTGALNLNFIHRLTGRATFSASLSAAYQNQPDFALVNAPTSNTVSSYLNAAGRFDLTYAWSPRFSTVTAVGYNLNDSQGDSQGDLYGYGFSNQFRYTVSARTTVTLEVREAATVYPSVPAQNSTDSYLLVGMDGYITARLRNTISVGEELGSYGGAGSGGGGSTAVPYLESDTTLALPRGGQLAWTNNYGLQDNGAVGQTVTSFRSGLSLYEPLGVKLGATLSIAYNYISSKARADSTSTSSPSTTGTSSINISNDNNNTTVNPSSNQTQFQGSLGLSYTFSPRFSMNLSLTYFDLLDSSPNSSYTREQISLGASYTF